MKRIFKRLAQLAAIFVLLVIGLLVALHWYQPKLHPVVIPPPKPVSGAAVFYYRAFEVMPKLTSAERKIMTKDPVSGEAKALFEKCNASLRLLEQGAALSDCEWGLDYTEGPGMNVPMPTKTFRACDIFAMRANRNFSENKYSAAVDDYVSIFRISRHQGKEPIMICKLVGIREEMIPMAEIARHLQHFDTDSLRRLREAIDALPPYLPMKEAVPQELAHFSAWFNNMHTNTVLNANAQTKVPYAEFRKDIFQFKIPDQEYTITGGIPIKYLVYSLRCFEENRQRLSNLIEMPFPEARPKLEAFEKEMERVRWSRGVYAHLAFAGMALAVLKDAQMDTIRNAFRVALDTQMRDPSALRAELSKLRDPYDGQPVEMRDVEGGVEIRLKAAEGRKPPTLMVALPPK